MSFGRTVGRMYLWMMITQGEWWAEMRTSWTSHVAGGRTTQSPMRRDSLWRVPQLTLTRHLDRRATRLGTPHTRRHHLLNS